MPNLNRTGPEGKGPMTGRRMGLCGNSEDMQKAESGQELIGLGRGGSPHGGGRGRGRGRGRGAGNGRHRRGFGGR